MFVRMRPPGFLGRVEQGFGGNAADVEADAAELGILFDDGGFESVLGGAHGGRIAAGAAPDHDYVVAHGIGKGGAG